MKYDKFGRELPDDTPVEMPIGYRRPLSMREEMMRMIREEMSRSAVSEGLESFEEANDFDVGEDDTLFPQSPHEVMEDEEFRSAEQVLLDKAAADMDNESRTVNDDRTNTGGSNGGRSGVGSGKEGKGVEAESGGKESAVDRSGDVRKEYAASGGKRGSASDGGGGVS